MYENDFKGKTIAMSRYDCLHMCVCMKIHRADLRKSRWGCSS